MPPPPCCNLPCEPMVSTTLLYRCHLLLWLLCSYLAGVGVADGWWGKSPEFGRAEDTVTVEEGETAKLPCVVYHLNERAVTWLRRRDLHILTAGRHTYSADDRFQVVHTEGSDEWTLVVRYAQLRDAGLYDCQVNTDPKLSRPVTLIVLDGGREMTAAKPKVFVANNTASTKDGHLRVQIQGPRELYIEEGSSLSLTCLVTSSSGPSTPVYWYHDTNLIDYNSPRGGVNLKIDQGRGETTTRLVVSAVGPGDSGMYSCVPPGSHPASVRVHVQKGDHEAAIQQGGLDESKSVSTASLPHPYLPLFLLFLLFYLPDLAHDFHSLFIVPIPLYSSFLIKLYVLTQFFSFISHSFERESFSCELPYSRPQTTPTQASRCCSILDSRIVSPSFFFVSFILFFFFSLPSFPHLMG
ncbi:zwei Ig domain protein zig-8-like [Panulirus ornatus]|uniref:zwei Ig domain protein zig-8-like n=1 Tax=Panulirus ornatus TaxID=150431 RepID=UPI003A8350D3